ncbi:DUF1365 domain-containing protein [Aquabacterium humicola]|uniref:DUF1365 domain-containing protein n=1 Tax=Aquabacterium humicola TaxID=3237377 RepID=UPI0025429181|nr:DUF1365 domain-containing protein [Rubrivivax pictus]
MTETAAPGKAVALIGTGRVWHRRLRPVTHAFAYPTTFLMLPMRRLRALPCAALARNRRAALSFHDADHGDGGPDALAWFDRLLAEHGIDDATGEAWLLTYPRIFGRVFKPVSFWWAERADGSLAAMLAEVNNTFGERHGYLLPGDALEAGGQAQAAKVMHVSPFCALEGRYRFHARRHRSAEGGPTAVQLQVDHDDASGPLLQTRLGGRLAPLDAAAVRRAAWRTPWAGLQVLARIHWQALRLALKRVPFFHHTPVRGPAVTR